MKIKFEAREVGLYSRGADGRWRRKGGNWRVIDLETYSFPYHRPGIGKILQDTTEAKAQAEADRLNGV